ncbi:MAG: hypothetical protein ACFB20_03330 [Opitutales bacterium]
MAASHQQEPQKLLAGESAALGLLSPYVGLLDVLERVVLDAPLKFHPLEQSQHGVKVFVLRLGGHLALLPAPVGKAVGADVLGQLPAALIEQALDPKPGVRAVLTHAPEGLQLSDVIAQVLLEELLGRIALKLRGQNACQLALLLGNDLGQLLFGDLLVARAQRDLRRDKLAIEPITATVQTLRHGFSGLILAAWLVDVGNHMFNTNLISCGLVQQNLFFVFALEEVIATSTYRLSEFVYIYPKRSQTFE